MARGRPPKIKLSDVITEPAALTPHSQLELGKLYVNVNDVWAINGTFGSEFQVHVKEAIIKVKPENLVLFENGSENE